MIFEDEDDTILESDIIQVINTIIVLILIITKYIFCNLFKDSTVNAIDQQAIVNKHNALRRQIANGQESRGNPGPQPPASNMRQMKWDANLAKAAQTLTNRCVFGHDVGILAGNNHYFIFILTIITFPQV